MAYFDEFVVKTQLAGLSTDTKPTAVDKYSLFLELDTKKFYYFNGEEWAEVGAGASRDIILAAEQTETATNDGSNRFVYTPTIDQNAFARFVNTLSEDNKMIATFVVGGQDPLEVELEYDGLDRGYYQWSADNPPCYFTIKSDGTDCGLTLNAGEGAPETLTMTYSLKIVPNE